MRSFFSISRLGLLVALATASAAFTGCGGGTTGVGGAPVITVGTTLASGTVGTPYSSTPNISGGSGAYTCTYTGSVPGLMTNNCTLTGTPTSAGTYTLTVSATDTSPVKGTGSATISVLINPSPIVINGISPSTATIGVSYTGTINITGGTGPYSCIQTGGPTLPATLSVASNCTITGTATSGAGSYSGILVRVTDSAATPQIQTGSVNITVAVGAAPTGTRVLSGGLPVIGASVQIYAAGKTGNGSVPTALLSTPMTTDSTGKFTVDTTKYTCPTSSIIYLVSTGGKAGAGGATMSSNVLMSSPGACSNLHRDFELRHQRGHDRCFCLRLRAVHGDGRKDRRVGNECFRHYAGRGHARQPGRHNLGQHPRFEFPTQRHSAHGQDQLRRGHCSTPA